MNDVSRAPENRFSDRVANYVRYRPSYPDALTKMLRREVGLRFQSVIADVGSGTGISAEVLLREGCTVYGIEPNKEMREAAERMLAKQDKFRSVNGTAEATTLADHSVDGIVAAQAFHWFKPELTRAEFTRVLKPAGWVALMWNERKLDTTPFLREYEALLIKHATDYARVRHQNVDANALGAFFLLGEFVTHTFSNEQRFDYDGLKGRLMSSSYVPGEGQPGFSEMINDLEKVFANRQVNGRVCVEYETRVHVGR